MKLRWLPFVVLAFAAACGGSEPSTAVTCDRSDAGDPCDSVADDELTADQLEHHLDDLEREIQEPRP